MKMVTRIAFANMKYHKSRNILIGIAIILTTLLLFLVPTVGKNMIGAQFAAVNELYPTWHALYRNVDTDTTNRLAAHNDISVYGLRSDAGYMTLSNKDALVSLMYLDEEGLLLYKMGLQSGEMPRAENEIVVSEGILEELGQTGEIGDIITVPYQIERDGGLDYTQEREFKITGFLSDTETSIENRTFTALISREFLEKEIPIDQVRYRFLFQVNSSGNVTTDTIEYMINQLALQFGISDNDININKEYLAANYVDPTFVPVIAVIMLIIVIAGIITIYSIYYISMAENIKEFGKLKAIGTTKRQLKQIVLREGYCVALFAVPIGLLIGTLFTKTIMKSVYSFSGNDNSNLIMEMIWQLIGDGKLSFYHWWIYLLSIVIVFVTIYLSLLKPMRVAAKVSEIEAMRYSESTKSKKGRRKSFLNISIFRLAQINITGNKKKNLMTICSMSITGIFLMIVATVLSCANPNESASGSILGQYEISVKSQQGNKEHPELEWSAIVNNNPLTDELKQQIESIDGINGVECFDSVPVEGEMFDYEDRICGVPEKYAKMLEEGIIEGNVTYEELKTGDKIILDKNQLHWYPDLAVGDILELTIKDGDKTYQKNIEIAAIGDYPIGLTNYDYFIMAKEGTESLVSSDNSRFFHITADRNYDEIVYQKLTEIVNSSDLLQIRTWQEEHDMWESAMSMTSAGCYAFLAILGIISIMNLVNTMIHSLHARKKEIGMMQAVGMSNGQLVKMLQMEGLCYTAGTLLLSLGIGSILGYPVFLWAKRDGMFNISNYHYPIQAAVIISVIMIALQLLLAFALGRSVKKESLIERIRFSE